MRGKKGAWHFYRENTNFLKSPYVFFTALKLKYTQKLFLYSWTKYLRYGWEGWFKKPPHPLFYYFKMPPHPLLVKNHWNLPKFGNGNCELFSIIIAILILIDELTIDAEIIFFLSITLDVDQNLIAIPYAKFIFGYTGFDKKNAIHQ